MKAWRKIWNITWRLAIAGLLMVWILHAIFVNETRQGWVATDHGGAAWGGLSRWDQWRQAWFTGPRALWHTLCLVEPAALMISFILMGLTILVGVFRWRLVLRVQGLDLPFSRAAEISLVAHFFNSFLLGSTGGDLLKAYYAARETHHKKTEAVTTVFVDRLLGLFAMLIFACVMMLPNWSLLGAHRRLKALAALIVLMLLGCGLTVALAFWGGVSRHWPQARSWLAKLPKGDLLDRSLTACRRFGREWRVLTQALMLSMVLNAICVFQVTTLASGLDLKISPLALFLIVPTIICISALPVTPSGLGVRENLYVLMLAVPEINVDATKALSLSLLAYAGSLFWSVMGGVVYVTLKERHHLAEITEPDVSIEERS